MDRDLFGEYRPRPCFCDLVVSGDQRPGVERLKFENGQLVQVRRGGRKYGR